MVDATPANKKQIRRQSVIQCRQSTGGLDPFIPAKHLNDLSLTWSCSGRGDTATSRPTSPIGWISIHVVGNLTSMDGIPTTRWKSIQWMEIPPRVGWISIHLFQNGWMEIQPSFGQRQTRFYDQFSNFLLFLFGVFKTMKVKVDYNSLEFGDFLQLRWGTLLSSIVRR